MVLEPLTKCLKQSVHQPSCGTFCANNCAKKHKHQCGAIQQDCKEASSSKEDSKDVELSKGELSETLIWLYRIHQQIGHKGNDVLYRVLKARGTHPKYLKAIEHFKCPACEKAKTPPLRRLVGTEVHLPGVCSEWDGVWWTYLITHKTTRFLFMIDVINLSKSGAD